jgi:hypothetical protein
MDDRTRVVVSDLGGGLFFLWLLVRFLEGWLDEYLENADRRSLLVGAVCGFSIQYASERDPIAPKLERYRYRLVRSLAVTASQRVLARVIPPRTSVNAGYLVGVVCHRIVFGAFRPVPEGRLRWPSVLDRLRRSDRESSA